MGNKLNPTFIPTDGLVAYYKLDGDATDSSGNGNNGTATNVTWVAAERGYVEEVGVFNGSSSKVDLGNILNEDGSTPFSWVVTYKTTSAATQTLMSKSATSGNFNGPLLRLYSTGYLIVNLTHSPSNEIQIQVETDATNDGDFHQLVLTYDGSKVAAGVKLFLDGVEKTTRIIVDDTLGGLSFGNTTTPFQIGARNSGTFFNGNIGPTYIYNKTLSQQEITTLYQEGLRQLGPTNLLNRSQGFPKYSLSNLEQGKILEISKPVNGGVYYDQTGNGNNSVSVVSVTDSTVGLNNVMSFNGVDSWIQTNDLISGKSALTIAATVKFNSISGIEPITANWASGTNQHLVRNNAGQLQFYLQTNINQYQLTAGSLSAGKYYRIINTYDGSIMRSYINGVEVGSLAASGTITNGTALDGWARYNTTYLDGDMSNLEIIDRAFSVSEVLQDYYSNKII